MSRPTVTPFKRHAPKLAVFVRVMDFWSGLLFPPRKTPPIDSTQLQSIAVAKMDHLGDLLMITPLLAEIRRQCPRSKLTLVVGKWNTALAQELLAQELCTEVIIYSPWGLNRGAPLVRALRENWTTFFQARSRLRALKVELYLDLRIWSFNSFLLGRLAGAKVVAGFVGREFSASLDVSFPYDPEKPLGQLFLDTLIPLGLTRKTYEGPTVRNRQVTPLVERIRETYPRYVILHGASADAGRTIPTATLELAIASLPADTPVLLLGSSKEGKMYEAISKETCPNCVNLAGTTSLADLLGLIESAQGGIVSDSFIAHLCLSFHVPSVVLMISDTSQRASFPAETPQTTFVNIADPTAVKKAAQALLPQ